tara:strand:- start:3646 stop:5172 length:1527 start_codon:yes stop_codon:yes gene_type:complete
MKVQISPSIGIIKIFKFLKYESWYALAEYIDNSISSYLSSKEEILKIEPNYKLNIDIEINFVDGSITITDNAGGIDQSKYEYAFRAAEVPEDTSGLNEFGMGMKTASSWLANKWTVTTSAFGEDFQRAIEFNVEEVVANDIYELEALQSTCNSNTHFTSIKLEELTSNAPHKSQLNSIKKHLSSIHRKFILNYDIQIRVNQELLEFEQQNILKAPKWDDENGEQIEWKIEIDSYFGNNKRVKGFVALLDMMSTSVHNGFSLFRRGRVIQGSGDELFRPKQLCGQVGSHQHKRVFGELELEGFSVDFTKGKFQNDEDFDELLDLIQDHCDSNEMPLLRQARNFRKPIPKESLKNIASKGVKEYNDSVKSSKINEKIENVIKEASSNRDEEISKPFEILPEKNSLEIISEEFEVDGQKWVVELELIDKANTIDWIDIVNEEDSEFGVRKIKARLSLVHPFMSSFGTEDIQPFIRIAIVYALSESAAYMSGGSPKTVRKYLNKFLSTALGR